MRQFYHKMRQNIFSKIRYQVVIYLGMFLLLPILFMLCFHMYHSIQLTRQKNQQVLDENLRLSRELLDTELAECKDLYFNICTDMEFMNNMVLLNQTTEETFQYRRIKDALETIIVSNILLCPETQAVGVIGTNDLPYLYVQKKKKNQYIEEFFDSHYRVLADSVDEEQRIRVGVLNDPSLQDAANSTFYIAVSCIHYEKMSPMGTLVLFLDSRYIQEILNNETSEIYDYANRILLTREQRIICDKAGHAGSRWEDVKEYAALLLGLAQGTELREQGSLVGTNQMVSVMDTDYFGMKVVNIIDYGEMNRPLLFFWTGILLVITMILVVTMMLAYILVGKHFISPIEQMADAMKSVTRDKLDDKITKIRQNEIGDIERSYNEMLDQIKGLLEENQRQTEYLLEMNQKACTAELKSLELQINPHFIFNTLDTINWNAIQDGSLTVSEQISMLASILRYTVYGINQIVPLANDIEWIRQYLQLQRIRFHNSFTYDIFADPSAEKLKIHKLLLQPFLENSLVHGFDKLPYTGYLRVDCGILRGKVLLIQVTDNGRGIDEKTLEQIRRLFATGSEKEFQESIGLSNIAFRTREYYKGSHLTVASGHGTTCFKLWIPIEEMEG